MFIIPCWKSFVDARCTLYIKEHILMEAKCYHIPYFVSVVYHQLSVGNSDFGSDYDEIALCRLLLVIPIADVDESVPVVAPRNGHLIFSISGEFPRCYFPVGCLAVSDHFGFWLHHGLSLDFKTHPPIPFGFGAMVIPFRVNNILFTVA